jgi:hypothetical protein
MFDSDPDARRGLWRGPRAWGPRAPREVLAGLLGALALAAGLAAAPVLAATSGPVRLRSGTVTVSISPGVYAKLTRSTAGSYPDTRTLTPIHPAATALPGVFAFPLSHGQVDPVGLTGTVATSGGIRFDSVSENPSAGQSSTVQFTLTRFALDLSSTPAELTATFRGTSTYHDIPIASLVTTSVASRTPGHTVSLTGFGLKLLASGAQLFNQQAYNNQSHRFRVGQSIGTATLTAVG